MKTALVVTLLAIAAAPASAQIRFSGQGQGCFGHNCAPALYSSTNYLNFTGSPFDDVTTNGAVPLSFGYFTWTPFSGISFVNSPFTLFLDFVYPSGITPAPQYGGYTAGLVIRGKIFHKTINTGIVGLVFKPNQQTFHFTGGQPNYPGQFTLTVNDLWISPTGTTQVNGYVSNASANPGNPGGGHNPPPPSTVPEPASMILLGSGLAGVMAARRRKKQSAE